MREVGRVGREGVGGKMFAKIWPPLKLHVSKLQLQRFKFPQSHTQTLRTMGRRSDD